MKIQVAGHAAPNTKTLKGGTYYFWVANCSAAEKKSTTGLKMVG